MFLLVYAMGRKVFITSNRIMRELLTELNNLLPWQPQGMAWARIVQEHKAIIYLCIFWAVT